LTVKKSLPMRIELTIYRLTATSNSDALTN